MAQPKTILIADDDAAIRTVLSHALTRAGYSVEATDNGATLYRWVVEGKGDLVITDVMMPGENGLDLIPKIRARRPGLKVIVISAQNALTTGVTASERGALDFLPKPFDVDKLLAAVSGAFLSSPAPEQNNEGAAEAEGKSFVVGKSPAMQEIYRAIAKLQNSDLTVLVTGESGTGKEVIARALHTFSQRKKAPFVAVNVAAIPKDLIESDLFGHEKGAFTGATQKSVGRFGQASGGTLFLDEIGDMPFEAQTRLLRVLQEGEYTTVGGAKPIRANVRVVAATNKDLRRLVREGTFREDLYYRLDVVPLHVPPLRDRRADIAALVQHFVESTGALKVFEPAAMTLIEAAPWPGNIRELENFVRRLAALHPQEVIDAATVRESLNRAAPAPLTAPDFSTLLPSYFNAPGVHARILRDIEKPMIEQALERTSGNQIKAAELLGLNRNTLRTKIRDLGVEVRRG